MKNLLSLSMVAACLFMVACNGNKEEGQTEKKDSVETTLTESQTNAVKDTVKLGDHQYIVSVLCEASDSLPQVPDEAGTPCKDNTITVNIQRDGQDFFKKAFTKQVFKSSLESDFYSKSILDGARYMEAKAGQGFLFTFSVGYPFSDMTNCFKVTVDLSGGYTFTKFNPADE